MFRAGIGVRGDRSYWRVDWTTLADPGLPLAVWALDTDADPGTGTSVWPGAAGVTSPGGDAFLIVSADGVWLEDAAGSRRDLTARGGRVHVDEQTKSFIAEVPRSALRVNGVFTVRLAAGVADAQGNGFAAAPERDDMRVYNAAFRTATQEGTRAAGPQRATGWNNGAQSAALAGGDISAFALELDWRELARGRVDPHPSPTGFSTRWYVSSVDLGPGLHPDTRQPSGQPPTTAPRVYGQVQPYLVYVPTTYDPEIPAPLTILLHGGGNNHNGFRGAREDHLFGPVCEERGSICLSPLGRGDGTWYVNEAELDVWEAWNRVAAVYALDGTRTTIAGHSMGGVGATRLATNHPDVFAGVGIVSGAGYRNAAGIRDAADDRERVENLAAMSVFLDAGTADIAEGNTRTWAGALEAAGVEHRAHYYAGATHGHFGWLGWREYAAHVGDAQLETAPGAIAFRWDPRENRTDLGIVIDSAYWLDGLVARDAAARWSRVEARSGALDTVVTEPVATAASAVYDGYQTEIRVLERRPVGTVPAADELDLELVNVAAADVDLAAAGLAGREQVRLRVTTDGPTTVRLHGDGAVQRVELEAGTHDILLG
ncbi:alpha/beta hydrolase-fold protein [Microbacterium ureisolvens]|uniref:alpha/beta hydrolase-fold protein n=1 Tax=Microbacterium ureisolvens TaxID=2781186 RepID=UPI00363D0D41